MTADNSEALAISEPKYPEVMEAPRYSCALGGALSTALGIFEPVAARPISTARPTAVVRMPADPREAPVLHAPAWWKSMSSSEARTS